MSNRLMRCPFCGVEPGMYTHRINISDTATPNIVERFYVISGCGIETPHFDSPSEAEAFWSMRV